MNDDTLRLIANPHLLKKHNVPTKAGFYESMVHSVDEVKNDSKY